VFDEDKIKGINIVSELAIKPWGMNEFTPEEIDGYWIRIGTGTENQ
jgi:hypothetical protein